MMSSSLSFALRALAIVLPISASLAPRVPMPQGKILRPIAIRDFEKATGLRRRSGSVELSDLDTKTQAELIYGTPGDNGQLLLANMTLYAEDGLEIVMMERFEGLTTSVDCNGDDGTMSLTFSSQDAFKYALQQWDFINNADDGNFLLIANHDGCGPDGERQPYLISKVTEDTASLTTFLTAQPAPWEDVSGTFDIDFGHITPYQKTPQLKERGLGDVFGGIGDTLQGNFDETKSANFDVSAGTKGQRSNIYSDSKFTLDCVNCFTTGSFAVTGHIATHRWSLSALTLSANPQDFVAELEMEAKISAAAGPASLHYEKELFVAPIPGAGISIPKIFNLGATLAYDVGIDTSFQGTATVDFGVSAGIPNTAQLTADLRNPGASSATGFGEGSLTPLFDVKDMSASVTLLAYSKPKITFGLEIIKIGTANVEVGVKLPQIDVTLTAAYDQAGVCSGNPSTTGIKLDSKLDVEVDLSINAKLGDSGVPAWSKPLFKSTKPIASKCFPLQIPGLAPSSTAIPTVSTTLALTQPATVTPTQVYSASGVSAVPIVNGTSYIIAPSGISVASSATALSGTPSLTGTGYIVGPSGISASGTGGIPLSSGNPPYPLSSGASGSAAPTGSRPENLGIVSASGLSTFNAQLPTGSASPSSTSTPSASGASTGPSSSGTLIALRNAEHLNSPPIRRAATGSDGCTMAKRFGKRVLVC